MEEIVSLTADFKLKSMTRTLEEHLVSLVLRLNILN